MFQLNGLEHRLHRRMSRRAMIRIGGLMPLGLSLPTLLSAGTAETSVLRPASFGRAKRCLMLYMWGGPSHIDLFDMKPDAPIEIRGEFQPIRTSAPGIQICEHLPKLAKQAHRIGWIRSVTHSDNNHSTSAQWMLTGKQPDRSVENFGAQPTDFPNIGSVLTKLAPAAGSLPTFVSLPEIIATTAGFVTPGQNAGFLGGRYDPFIINQHPDDPGFQVQNLAMVDGLSADRLQSRCHLLQQFESLRSSVVDAANAATLSAYQQQALDLVTSPEARGAFDLEKEGARERDRYGRQTFGQSLLLARRLLEAGVKLVTVYWHRDKPGVDTTWDTHSSNFKQLKDRLLPQVDGPLSTLLEDLAQRGLLEDTLVVWSSEFGRTPKINASDAGRDHWGSCNTVWMAGAGVPGGYVYGASDRIASEPIRDPVSPSDLSATLYHLLGVEPRTLIRDLLDRPLAISEGQVLNRFLQGSA